ncbi:hypothetical protein PV326_002579 [Microctonus aethiopoides]|nr:hypothetical protein PV326_002579 [Microctonus aethiopoides]
MVNGSSKSLEEVQSVITALLVAEKKKHGIDVVELDQIYKNAECERIPFRALGFTSLVAFLRTVPGIEVLSQNYGHVINFTGKESSRHLSELVARQRSSDSKNRRNRSSNCRRIAPHYISRPRAPSPKRDNLTANEILGIVQRYPKGLLRSELLRIYLQTHPGSGLDSQKLLYHLRTLESKVMVRESMVYPSRNLSVTRCTTPRSNSENKENGWNSKSVATSGIIPNKFRVVPDSGGEDMDYFDNDDNLDFVTPSTPMIKSFDGFVPVKNNPTQAVSNFIENFTSQCQEKTKENNGNLPAESEDQEGKKTFNENDFIFSKNQEYIAQLLNERTQFRLEKLIQNNPDGIWCIDLPKKYKEEYNISLDWENLGFQRIGDFAAYLPHIFHIIGPYPNGDFRLYDAKSPPPTQEKKKTEEHPKQTLAGVYNIYNSDDDEIEAVPSNIPISLSNQLIPDDVLTIGESVGQISVTTFTDKITDKRSLVAVRVVEAFHPSFFWVQIEKKQQRFKDMMNQLHTFYEEKKAKYCVPIIMLEKGLNVACMFFGKWHRGIIKAVDHKCQVTVILPAQAIPCGLYNVRPFEGDQWPKNVVDSFIKRVYDRPLWATIGKLDVENNTMLISLTDVSQQDYDFHISDWMFEKKMAIQGHMVRIRLRNFVYQHFLQSEMKSKSKINLIDSNNVNNRTRLSSIDNSLSSDENYLKNYDSNRRSIQNKISYCPKCGQKVNQSLIKEEKIIGDPKTITTLHNIEISQTPKSINEDDNSLEFKNSIDNEIIISDEPVMKPLNINNAEILTIPTTNNTLIPLSKNLPEKIPEFGTFASPLGGHGRMEPIDWNTIRASAQGRHHVGDKDEKSNASLLSTENENSSLNSPSLMNVKKQVSKLESINHRYEKFFNECHYLSSYENGIQSSATVLKPEGHVTKSHIITPMVRRTLNHIDEPVEDHVQVIVPDDIKLLINDSSSSVVTSSEKEITGWDSPGDERNYAPKKLEINQINSNDSLSSGNQQMEEDIKSLSETDSLNNNKEDNKFIDDSGDKLHDENVSISSDKTNSIRYVSGKINLQRFGQLMSIKKSTSCSDDNSTIDSDDSMYSQVMQVIEKTTDNIESAETVEVINNEQNTTVSSEDNDENSVVQDETNNDKVLALTKNTPFIPVLNDDNISSDDSEMDCYISPNDLIQMFPQQYKQMFENQVQENNKPQRVEITEVDSNDEDELIKSDKSDISTDISSDVNDPKDLNNYVEDYGEDCEVMNQYETDQNPLASEGVIKLPSDISTVTVKSFCSALSILEKKQGIIMTTANSIDNLQSSMQKLIFRHYEMISNMQTVMNDTLLINMSEMLAKTIMDLVRDALTIIQPNQENDSNIVESSTANQQENLQLGDDSSTNACPKNDNDNEKSIIHHESNDESKNVTISLDIPLNTESSNQLLLENATNEPEINQSESLDDTNEKKDLSNDLNIPKAIEINPTVEQTSCDQSLAEENLCKDISAEEISDQVAMPTVCEVNELDRKCQDEFEIFISKAADTLTQRQNSDVISDEMEVEEKSFSTGEDLKDTNPFKKYILLNAQPAENLISPPPLPSRFESTAQSEHVTSSSDFVHNNNVKIVYQASPVMYDISKKNLDCDSQVKANLSLSEKPNFLNKKLECIDKWQRNHSKANEELNINRDCDDDNGYESGVSSMVVNWLDLQKNEQLLKIDENNTHDNLQVNDKDVTINNNCPVSSNNQIILPVQLTHKTVCIISINNEGWVTLTEFRSTFTTFGDDNGFHRYLNIALPSIEKLILLRADYPELFDRYESWKYFRMRRNQPIGQRQVPEKLNCLSLIRLTSILTILRKMSIITKEEIEMGLNMNQSRGLRLSSAMIDVVKLISSYGSYRKLQSSN